VLSYTLITERASVCWRLNDVQKWIEAGKSLEIASAKHKKTLLQVAVEIGFHGLVELIAKREGSQASRDAALADAVSIRSAPAHI
jgi:hypothetical protein